MELQNNEHYNKELYSNPAEITSGFRKNHRNRFRKIIEIDDAVYTFNEVVSHIDLRKYFAEKESKTGRPRYDRKKLLKVVLFAFMERGYPSLREIEKLCKTDIRFLWLLDDMAAPTYGTLCNFINKELSCELEEIARDINGYHTGCSHVGFLMFWWLRSKF